MVSPCLSDLHLLVRSRAVNSMGRTAAAVPSGVEPSRWLLATSEAADRKTRSEYGSIS
jgi:hypothetical protein